MVTAESHLRLATGPDPARSRPSRHRWHRARAHAGFHRSILGTLVRLDDDPVLFCDCAEGGPHTCG